MVYRKRLRYVEETNFNLFCSQNYGWSRRGTRAGVTRPGARGDNLNVVACISSYGLEHVEFRWGANDAEVVDGFVPKLLDGLMDKGVSLFEVVVVCANASIYAGVKEELQHSDYVGITLEKLSPYSPMSNPIKNAFSAFKSGVKSYLSAHRDTSLRVPAGVSKVAHSANYMLRAAQYGMASRVTLDLCNSEAAHTLAFHTLALEKRNMPVGA